MRLYLACSLFLIHSALGYDTGHHFDVSHNALKNHADFSDDAIKVVQVANWMPDWWGQTPKAPSGMKDFDDLKQHCVSLHLDGLYEETRFTVYLAQLVVNTRNALSNLAKEWTRTELYPSAKKALIQYWAWHVLCFLGVTLHTIQDIYTHSSFVEKYFIDTSTARKPTWFDATSYTRSENLKKGLCYGNLQYWLGWTKLGAPAENYGGQMQTGYSMAVEGLVAGGEIVMPETADPHGGYVHGINKDAPGFKCDRANLKDNACYPQGTQWNNWDKGYAVAYVATASWTVTFKKWVKEFFGANADAVWTQVTGWKFSERTSTELDQKVGVTEGTRKCTYSGTMADALSGCAAIRGAQAAYHVSNWIAVPTKPVDGHWKGYGSGRYINMGTWTATWLYDPWQANGPFTKALWRSQKTMLWNEDDAGSLSGERMQFLPQAHFDQDQPFMAQLTKHLEKPMDPSKEFSDAERSFSDAERMQFIDADEPSIMTPKISSPRELEVYAVDAAEIEDVYIVSVRTHAVEVCIANCVNEKYLTGRITIDGQVFVEASRTEPKSKKANWWSMKMVRKSKSGSNIKISYELLKETGSDFQLINMKPANAGSADEARDRELRDVLEKEHAPTVYFHEMYDGAWKWTHQDKAYHMTLNLDNMEVRNTKQTKLGKASNSHAYDVREIDAHVLNIGGGQLQGTEYGKAKVTVHVVKFCGEKQEFKTATVEKIVKSWEQKARDRGYKGEMLHDNERLDVELMQQDLEQLNALLPPTAV